MAKTKASSKKLSVRDIDAIHRSIDFKLTSRTPDPAELDELAAPVLAQLAKHANPKLALLGLRPTERLKGPGALTACRVALTATSDQRIPVALAIAKHAPTDPRELLLFDRALAGKHAIGDLAAAEAAQPGCVERLLGEHKIANAIAKARDVRQHAALERATATSGTRIGELDGREIRALHPDEATELLRQLGVIGTRAQATGRQLGDRPWLLVLGENTVHDLIRVDLDGWGNARAVSWKHSRDPQRVLDAVLDAWAAEAGITVSVLERQITATGGAPARPAPADTVWRVVWRVDELAASASRGDVAVDDARMTLRTVRFSNLLEDFEAALAALWADPADAGVAEYRDAWLKVDRARAASDKAIERLASARQAARRVAERAQAARAAQAPTEEVA